MSRTDERGGLYGSPAPPARQRRALAEGRVPVAVHGLGKLGLPVAATFAERTGNVTGVDVDPGVVEALRAGDCPVPDEPGLPELVADLVEEGALSATTDPSGVEASVHVLVVPTLIDEGRPDLSAVRSAARAVGEVLSPGDLVVVESTLPPGGARSTVLPTLEATSGLDAGEFGLAVCPERTQSGRALTDVRGAYPRVVGGIDDESTRAAALVYEVVTDADLVRVADATTAECVKVFEGVYRDLNVALANELARLADELGVDVRAAIEAANTQPYCDLHDPGPGVGGHCIPYYPQFLASVTDTDTPLIQQGRAVNDSMPAFAVRKLATLLSAEGVAVGDASVAVLGVTYRPGVPELRKSPARDVARILSTLGADPFGVDPLVDRLDDDLAFPVVDVDRFRDLAPDVDAAVLVTPHEELLDLEWPTLEPMVVVDGRDALDLSATDHHAYTLGDGRR